MVANDKDYLSYINTKDIGQIGDLLGGTTAPLIGGLGVILTFLAFIVQYQANQQQRDDINKQRKDWENEQLSGRFFELLRLHKDNVAELEIRDEGKNEVYKGRRTFMAYYIEFEAVYRVTLFRNSELVEELRKQVNVDCLAYAIFYFGIGDTVRKSVMKGLNHAEKIVASEVLADLCLAQLSFSDDFNWFSRRYGGNFAFIPFRGHSSSLGSYYRHLYQTIKYVDGFSEKVVTRKRKYDLVRTLRDQLSEFEQLLLYFNALGFYEDDWYEIFTKYRFIKNMQLEYLPDNYPDPIKKYKTEMIKLWLSEDKAMFAGQGDITHFVEEWAKGNEQEYTKIVAAKEAREKERV
ncbi:hypothetical protein GCM10011379_06990 [Filimonas zeae]|uniref:Phage abortive infection protein n=2 Tax=Filimonas zeae TaxID=1737353 RepID=A0A917MRE8_9BACT|nr:hypothetical protein GCM10011379_06990 [Filimonas zeae]